MSTDILYSAWPWGVISTGRESIVLTKEDIIKLLDTNITIDYLTNDIFLEFFYISDSSRRQRLYNLNISEILLDNDILTKLYLNLKAGIFSCDPDYKEVLEHFDTIISPELQFMGL